MKPFNITIALYHVDCKRSKPDVHPVMIYNGEHFVCSACGEFVSVNVTTSEG